MRADLAAFRRLSRICRAADRVPERLVTLIGRPPRRYDNRQGIAVRTKYAGSPFAEDAICEMCGGSTEFAHPGEKPGSMARNAVRKHFLRAKAMGLPYVQEADALARRVEAAVRVASEVESPLRASARAAAVATEAGHDSEEVHGLLPAPPAALRRLGPLAREAAKPGDLLLTHPLACLSEPAFDQAVILLDAVDEAAGIVAGVVMNKPVGATLAQVLQRWPSGLDKARLQSVDLGELLHCRLYRGGPVIDESLEGSLRWIHIFGDVAGAGPPPAGGREIAPGLWVGGDLAVIASRAQTDPSGVRFVLGYSAWSSLQLRIELECGTWVRARAMDSAAPPERPEAGAGSRIAAVCDGAPSVEPLPTCIRDVAMSNEERGMAWRTAMRSVGLPVFADFPRTPGVDRRLRGYVENANREACGAKESDAGQGSEVVVAGLAVADVSKPAAAAGKSGGGCSTARGTPGRRPIAGNSSRRSVSRNKRR